MASKVTEDAIRMFRNGVEVPEIASALKITVATVLTLLLRGGVKTEEFEGLWDVVAKGQEVNATTRAALVGEYKKFVPIPVIAKKFGLQPEMVWQILMEEGVPIRKYQSGRTREVVKLRRDEEIVSMYLEGVEIWEIASAVGVSLATVTNVCRKYNVPSRKVITHGKIRKTPVRKGELIHPRDILRDKFGIS